MSRMPEFARDLFFQHVLYNSIWNIKNRKSKETKKSIETENTLLFGAQEWRQLRVSANNYFQVMKMFENEIMLIVRNWVRILRLHILR